MLRRRRTSQREADMLKRVLTILFLSIMSVPTTAQRVTRLPEVDLALVLAIDSSGSVNADRWALQQYGYATALRSPEVLNAIAGGPNGAIAVTVVQWAEFADQVIGWHVIESRQSAEILARKLESLPYQADSSTGVANAIVSSIILLKTAPFSALRRIIDISGDGKENAGGVTPLARDLAIVNGMTVNGLPIVAQESGVSEFYESQVIGGPGAFSITVRDMKTFPAAVRRKLVREIASR